MKSLAILFIVLLGFTANAANEPMKCIHENAYGQYTGFGTTKADARSQASSQCFNTLVNVFEKTKKRLPTDLEAELILTQQCLNICS